MCGSLDIFWVTWICLALPLHQTGMWCQPLYSLGYSRWQCRLAPQKIFPACHDWVTGGEWQLLWHEAALLLPGWVQGIIQHSYHSRCLGGVVDLRIAVRIFSRCRPLGEGIPTPQRGSQRSNLWKLPCCFGGAQRWREVHPKSVPYKPYASQQACLCALQSWKPARANGLHHSWSQCRAQANHADNCGIYTGCLWSEDLCQHSWVERWDVARGLVACSRSVFGARVCGKLPCGIGTARLLGRKWTHCRWEVAEGLLMLHHSMPAVTCEEPWCDVLYATRLFIRWILIVAMWGLRLEV
jgi:hypothetical protein